MLVLAPLRRRSVLLAATPLLLVVALYGKNWLRFGTFSASSWGGLSLAKLAVIPQPEDLRKALVSSGEISSASLVMPFSALPSYGADARSPLVSPLFPAGPHPALDAPFKTTGAPNLNHRDFVAIAQHQMHDSLVLLRRSPGIYFRELKRSWITYAIPTSDYFAVVANRAHIAKLDTFYRKYIWGVRNEYTGEHPRPIIFDLAFVVTRVCILGAAIGALGLLFGLVSPFLTLRNPEALPQSATMLFISGTVLYATIIFNLVEINENHRCRAEVEGLFMFMAAAAFSRLLSALAPLRARLRTFRLPVKPPPATVAPRGE